MKSFLSRNKKVIIAIIFTFMITSSLTVYATLSYKANEIEYTSKNANFKASTVQDALDTLHYSATTKNYSVEEKIVGTWIDGKPIYRKVIDLGYNFQINSSGAQIPKSKISDSNMYKHIISSILNITSSENEKLSVIEYCQTVTSNDSFRIIPKETWNARQNRRVILILEYTKTTD